MHAKGFRSGAEPGRATHGAARDGRRRGAHAAAAAGLAQAAKEAPALAKLAADGKLPPLAERLPANPLVVQPSRRSARYGGTLRRGLRGCADHNGILRMVGNQGLVRWNLDFTEVLPNVAERWDVNADSTEFTFHLRKGMKWSDGKPFTADDIVFSIEDCAKNTELYKSPPSTLVIGGKACTVDQGRRRRPSSSPSPGPYALFLEQLATPLGQHPTLFAKHYCSQFHPKYNAERRRPGEGGQPVRLGRRCSAPSAATSRFPSRWGNADKPTLDPWVIKEPYSGGATRVVMERNPYFWQVDTDGNQLPYIDQHHLQHLAGRRVADARRDLRASIDIQERHIDSLPEQADAVAEHAEGRLPADRARSAPRRQQVQIYLNITHKDPKMREMFANKEFRKALSLGINRKEIIDIVYLGQSEPYQTGPRPGHPWYHEKLARQFTEFNAAEANAHPRQGSASQEGRAAASACGPTGRSCSSPST